MYLGRNEPAWHSALPSAGLMRTTVGPRVLGEETCSLVVRVLWTCSVGDDLYENGCMFLEADEEK